MGIETNGQTSTTSSWEPSACQGIPETLHILYAAWVQAVWKSPLALQEMTFFKTLQGQRVAPSYI